MINWNKLARTIYNKCQTQFETAFISESELLSAINAAKDLVCLECQRKWSLTYEYITPNPLWKIFTLAYEWHNFLSARWKKAWSTEYCELKITSMPIFDSLHLQYKAYVDWKDVTTSEEYETLYIVYNRVENDINTTMENFNIPSTFFSILFALACSIIYVWGLEQWADLSNKFIADAERRMAKYKSSYQMDAGSKWIKPWVPV